MAFSSKQTRELRAQLKPGAVRARDVEGKTLHYIEGWYALAEANRIFGFDGWDRETLSSQCVWQKALEGRYAVAYLTRVRITVRAGEQLVLREALGSGEAQAASLGQAHERAAKAAETDATKRALSTFGNRFGLSLYGGRFEAVKDTVRQQSQRRSATAATTAPQATSAAGPRAANDEAPAQSIHNSATQLPAPNEASVPSTGSQRMRPPAGYRVSAPLDPSGLGHFLETVRAPVSSDPPAHLTPANDPGRKLLLPVTAHVLPPPRIPVDKSTLPIGEPKRLRSPEHLRFVARQPCLICGRQPTQAHHLRFAQPRALSRKVSDEYAVPLCPFHHDEVHKTGNEFQWWRARGIEALKIARDLWAETRDFPGSSLPTIDESFNEPTKTRGSSHGTGLDKGLDDKPQTDDAQTTSIQPHAPP